MYTFMCVLICTLGIEVCVLYNPNPGFVKRWTTDLIEYILQLKVPLSNVWDYEPYLYVCVFSQPRPGKGRKVDNLLFMFPDIKFLYRGI